MPSYDYVCPEGHQHEELFLSLADAEPHQETHPCPECAQAAERVISGGTTLSFVGHFPGERVKLVDHRKARQALRYEAKVAKGEMTEEQVEKAAAIRDRYAKTSPYTLDPKEAKGKDQETAKKREASTGHFHDEETMVVRPQGE